MEAKQEEQARQMAELCEHVNRLHQENERLQTRLETNQGDNSKGPVCPAPPTQPNKGKEPILMGESDPPADDELSYDSTPLPALSPPQNNAKAKSKKRPFVDPTDLSVARVVGYKERPETDAIRN